MERFEKDPNVLSVDEVLENEKAEKINEVIQLAKAEEEALELSAVPRSPEEWFEEIFEKLREDGTGDEYKREIEYKKTITLDGIKYKKIEITLQKAFDDNVGDVEELYVKYKKDGKKVNYCVQKYEENGKTKIRIKNLEKKGSKRMKPNAGVTDEKLREIYRVADAVTKALIEENT